MQGGISYRKGSLDGFSTEATALQADGTTLRRQRRKRATARTTCRRFALVRVLARDPAFLFADEPTSRLDPILQRETMALLLACAAEANTALLLVTHDVDIAAKVTSRSFALNPGDRFDR